MICGLEMMLAAQVSLFYLDRMRIDGELLISEAATHFDRRFVI